LLCGEQYGAPYDLLATALGTEPARLRGITARWRHAGYAATGRLGPGPAWCWLTPSGMAVTGLGYRATRPDYPRTVQAPETRLDDITGAFFTTHIFGPGRRDLLAARLPATDHEAAERRDTETAALTARIRQLDTAQNAQITALETIPADDPAGAAMRARIRDRFTELHTQRQQAETRLAALTTATPKAADPALLDELPRLGDIIPALPNRLKARLFAAFDLTILWNKTSGQATISVEITDATLQALPAILNPGQGGYHDTSTLRADPAPMRPLDEHTRACTASPRHDRRRPGAQAEASRSTLIRALPDKSGAVTADGGYP
jgi:hypothetical protein